MNKVISCYFFSYQMFASYDRSELVNGFSMLLLIEINISIHYGRYSLSRLDLVIIGIETNIVNLLI